MSTILLQGQTAPAAPTAGKIRLFVDSADGLLKSIDSTATIYTLAPPSLEQVQDMVGGLLQAGSSKAIVTYNDAGNVLTIDVDPSQISHTSLQNIGTNTHAQIDSHLANTSNPHSVTKAQIGLGSVQNLDTTNPVNITQDSTHRFTTDAEKATWNAKENAITATTTADYYRGDKSFQPLNKAAVGLSNVDNTSDASKPVSTLQAAADTAVQSFSIQRANHTGTQLRSTISDFDTGITSSVLTGMDITTIGNITPTDTILSAIGKLVANDNTWTELVTTANLTNTSNATLSNVTELGISVVSGKVYKIEASLLFSSTAGNTGIVLSYGATGAAGTVSLAANIPIALDGTAAMLSGWITTFGDVVTGTGVQTANTFYIARLDGIFVCTTSGTIFPQFRSETNGQTITLRAGSVQLSREF